MAEKTKLSSDRAGAVVVLARQDGRITPNVFWGQGVQFVDWGYFYEEMVRSGIRYSCAEEYERAKTRYVRGVCERGSKKLQDGFIPN